jgi:hypothetical protein
MASKGLKNYTTEIPAQRTISEIEEILVKHGATDTWKQYDSPGKVTTLNFAVNTEFGKMPFKLSIDAQVICEVLKEQSKHGLKSISRKQASDIEHARNVGWRIVKDWIDAQMAMVFLKMRKLEQIFLADIYDMRSEKTFFQILRDKKYAGLLMGSQEQK